MGEQDSEGADKARDYGLDQATIDEMQASGSEDEAAYNDNPELKRPTPHRKHFAMYPAQQTKATLLPSLLLSYSPFCRLLLVLFVPCRPLLRIVLSWCRTKFKIPPPL